MNIAGKAAGDTTRAKQMNPDDTLTKIPPSPEPDAILKMKKNGFWLDGRRIRKMNLLDELAKKAQQGRNVLEIHGENNSIETARITDFLEALENANPKITIPPSPEPDIILELTNDGYSLDGKQVSKSDLPDELARSVRQGKKVIEFIVYESLRPKRTQFRYKDVKRTFDAINRSGFDHVLVKGKWV